MFIIGLNREILHYILYDNTKTYNKIRFLSNWKIKITNPDSNAILIPQMYTGARNSYELYKTI